MVIKLNKSIFSLYLILFFTSSFEVDDGFCSPVIPRNISSKNSSHDRDSFICSKKLLFHDEDLENL